MIVRSVRVGIPVAQAIATVATECPQPTSRMGPVRSADPHRRCARSGSAADRATSRRRRIRFFATVISLQGQTEKHLTEVLENFADMIRKRVALRSRGYALSSEARTSALVLTVMPGTDRPRAVADRPGLHGHAVRNAAG